MGVRPCASPPKGETRTRLSSARDTRTSGRRNNGRDAGEHPGIPRSACRQHAAGRARQTRKPRDRLCGAHPRRARTARHRGHRHAVERRRGIGAVAVRPRTQRRLAGLAGRPAARPGRRPLQLELPDADAADVRELPAGAGGRAAAAHRGARRRDRAGSRDPAAGSAADLTGRVRLSGVRPHGCPAWARPVHARGRRSAGRSDLPVRRLAVPALAVRPAVHTRQLRARSARAGGGAVGAEGRGRAREPRRRGPDRHRGRSYGPLRTLGRGVRRAESCPAGAGRRRGAQRHAAAAGARAGAVPERRCQPSSAGRGAGARRWRSRQGHGGARAAVPGARLTAATRACGRRRERLRGPAGRRGRGPDRLRRARARLPRRGRRAAAAHRHTQHSRRDRAPGWAERDTQLVAPPVPRRVRGRPRVCAVAHRARCRLARGRRLEHDRAAVLDRVAFAVVCDLGAAASGRRRRSAPARRRAPALRLRGSDPPAAGRPRSQPLLPPRRQPLPAGRPRDST